MNSILHNQLLFWMTMVSTLLFGFFKANYPSSSLPTDLISKTQIKSHFKKMIYMEGGTFNMWSRSGSDFKMTDSDSTLILTGMPTRTKVDPYYISATEVTNAEWNEFYQDKVMELGVNVARREFYPDTTLMINRYGVHKAKAKHYLSMPQFYDHPVAGITWDQAKEFCQWKSNNLKKLLAKKGITTSIVFRLPTEKEWEFAAIYESDNSQLFTKKTFYPWSQDSGINQLNKLTNIGQIHDINNVLLKSYDDDGCLYTCKVASYPANNRGMYDMGGNVSEWTSDKGSVRVHDFKNDKRTVLEIVTDFDNELKNVKKRYEDDNQDYAAKLYYESLSHDIEVFRSGNMKICKGGSWANGIIYAQTGSRQAVNKDKPSEKIGFRIAISINDEDVIKYLPKKNWKPKS